jgi:hypothetical protein
VVDVVADGKGLSSAHPLTSRASKIPGAVQLIRPLLKFLNVISAPFITA